MEFAKKCTRVFNTKNVVEVARIRYGTAAVVIAYGGIVLSGFEKRVR